MLFRSHKGLVAPQHVGSSRTGDQTRVSCIGRWILYRWAPREATLSLRREESSWKTSPFYIKALSAEKPPFPTFTYRGLHTALPRRERQDSVLPVACEFHETPPWQLFNRPDEGSEQHVFSCSYTSTITDCIVPGLKIHFQSFFFFLLQSLFLCSPTLPATFNGFSTFTTHREVRKYRPLLRRE